jgi:hypothetical protein
MATLLQGGPPSSDSSPAGSQEVTVRVVADGGRRGGLLGRIVTTVVVGALAAGVLVVAGVLTGVIGIANPFGTSTVDRSSPALLKELTNLSKYSAAQGHFTQTLDVEEDVAILPSFIAGERTTFLADGTVDATIDFSGLSSAAVQPHGDGSVTVVLPKPRLDEAEIDPERSRVVGRERGLLDRVGGVFSDNPTSEQRFYVLARDKIGKAARHSDLVARAERNTTRMLQGFLGKLGYDEVDVVFEAPAAAAKSAR